MAGSYGKCVHFGTPCTSYVILIPFKISAVGPYTSLLVNSVLPLGAFAKFRKSTVGFVVSVCPSVWNNSAPTGRIFMKFGNMSRKIQVLLKSDKNNGYFI